jgi:hypothetical protein
MSDYTCEYHALPDGYGYPMSCAAADFDLIRDAPGVMTNSENYDVQAYYRFYYD